jgi:hypothetical protein
MEQDIAASRTASARSSKLEDINGLKIRTIQNPLYVDMMNALGANAVPMAFTELYGAMEQKAVDGQENPYATAEASKFYEVQVLQQHPAHLQSGNDDRRQEVPGYAKLTRRRSCGTRRTRPAIISARWRAR